MSWSTLVRSLSTVLCLRFLSVAHSHTDTYHVTAGHLFLLRCPSEMSLAPNVTWSRAGRPDVSLPREVEVRDGLLWFLPVQASHDGTYTCERRSKAGLLQLKFRVLVSTSPCPDPVETRTARRGVSEILPCKQSEIFRLNNITGVRWMKDCHPMKVIDMNKNGDARAPFSLTEKDSVKYTCLVDVSVNGRTYTAARSFQLTVNNDTVLSKPDLVHLQEKVVVQEDTVLSKPDLVHLQEKVVVQVGKSVELKCKAFIGFNEVQESVMYWTVDGKHTDAYKGLSESSKNSLEKGRVHRESTLSIPKVLPLFLNVPIVCHITTLTGYKNGSVLLQEDDHTVLYISVAFCLAASLALLTLAAVILFKVNVVLSCRKLRQHFSEPAPDGKLYDAYVSFLHPETLSSAEAANFALQILPKELEAKHGYSLYIRGRDDRPGEAFHDAVAETIRQCRRLIIVLSQSSTDGNAAESSPLRDDQNKLCYEQKIGIYDALTQNDLRVILVEMDGAGDYSRLPESLRYIKRKQGALKWTKDFLGTNKLTKLYSSRSFWNNLRYQMPSVPARKHPQQPVLVKTSCVASEWM